MQCCQLCHHGTTMPNSSQTSGMAVGTADKIGLTAMASLGSLASWQADQAGPGHLIEVLIESKGLVNLAGAGGCQT